mmetsp:Transcript_72074/g.208749  ORF Transcript_72074/g.208749 Transcript_72074/m.208749 type:complete len:224 (-) Transcript_72074:56-727(-)
MVFIVIVIIIHIIVAPVFLLQEVSKLFGFLAHCSGRRRFLEFDKVHLVTFLQASKHLIVEFRKIEFGTKVGNNNSSTLLHFRLGIFRGDRVIWDLAVVPVLQNGSSSTDFVWNATFQHPTITLGNHCQKCHSITLRKGRNVVGHQKGLRIASLEKCVDRRDRVFDRISIYAVAQQCTSVIKDYPGTVQKTNVSVKDDFLHTCCETWTGTNSNSSRSLQSIDYG